MNYVIILSGGTGSRLRGIDRPKQYYKVGERTILSYCIERVDQCEAVDAWLVVADTDWQQAVLDEIRMLARAGTVSEDGRKFLGFAQPGENRQLSILHGLRALQDKAEEPDIVMIQDAARPCTSVRQIGACMEAAKSADGAMPVLPMRDTVYYSEDGTRVDALLAREKILAGQAPEAYVFGKYLRANEALTEEEILGINGSTEPAVRAGMQIALVEGDERNFKITTAEDLRRFERIMEDDR